MTEKSTEVRWTCLECGITAPTGGAWEKVTYPPLGTLTQCAECGCTNVHREA